MFAVRSKQSTVPNSIHPRCHDERTFSVWKFRRIVLVVASGQKFVTAIVFANLDRSQRCARAWRDGYCGKFVTYRDVFWHFVSRIRT